MRNLDRLQRIPRAEHVDVIHVTELQLPAGIISRDIWGDNKIQPALVTLELEIYRNHGFDTVESTDKLGAQTIHYGHLCKKIRTACQEALSLEATEHAIWTVLRALGMKDDNRFIISQAVLNLILPKATAYGQGIVVGLTQTYDTRGVEYLARWTVTYSALKIMTLVGVNAQERTGLQALELTCELSANDGTSYSEVLGIERDLVELVSKTEFETLEALALTTADGVKQLLTSAGHKAAAQGLKLRFDKPSAVAFAAAPAIEVRRILRESYDDDNHKSNGNS